MQNWEDLNEIEALGEEEDESWEEGPPSPAPAASEGLGAVPLLQALVCALAIIGLLYLRYTGHPAYGALAERYRAEAAQEWEVPDLPILSQQEAGGQATPSPSPAPTPAPHDAPTGLPGPQVQRL
ncbi:hypothetical protein D5272_05315 [bacterium D16-76]|nr:hypothetical protein [bacterium D16-76]